MILSFLAPYLTQIASAGFALLIVSALYFKLKLQLKNAQDERDKYKERFEREKAQREASVKLENDLNVLSEQSRVELETVKNGDYYDGVDLK